MNNTTNGRQDSAWSKGARSLALSLLSACSRGMNDAEVQKAMKDVNVIDESNLSDIMLTVGDPNEAVTYFSNALAQNPDRADLKRGLAKSLVRAGKPTEQYLSYVLSRLTFPGSIYLAIVAVIPLYAFGSLGVGQQFIFGGTSLLIMVGVGLDTVKQIEAQLQQRSYEGFLR